MHELKICILFVFTCVEVWCGLLRDKRQIRLHYGLDKRALPILEKFVTDFLPKFRTATDALNPNFTGDNISSSSSPVEKIEKQLELVPDFGALLEDKSAMSRDTPGEPLSDKDLVVPRGFLQEPEVNHSAIYDPNYFEGDIIGTKLIDRKTEIMARSGPRHLLLKWPLGIVPYIVSSDFLPHERKVLMNAIREIESKSCIQWVPRDETRFDHADYVHIIKASGCRSPVGRQGGGQPLILGTGCLSQGIVVHEMLHTLGMFHEQSRPDRDQYINVKSENIQNEMQKNFEKYSAKIIDTLDLPYDTGSILHYSYNAFSANGRNTVVPLTGEVGNMGQRNEMSDLDVQKLNKLYQCQQSNPLKLRLGSNNLGLPKSRMADIDYPVDMNMQGDRSLKSSNRVDEFNDVEFFYSVD